MSLPSKANNLLSNDTITATVAGPNSFQEVKSIEKKKDPPPLGWSSAVVVAAADAAEIVIHHLGQFQRD